jgi:hypothetical protein
MTDSPLSPLHGLDPARGADAASKQTRAPHADGGAAFRALLDELQDRARELERASQEPLSPQRLSGAVDEARASLTQAESLGDRLLEAFRAARQASDGAADGGGRP